MARTPTPIRNPGSFTMRPRRAFKTLLLKLAGKRRFQIMRGLVHGGLYDQPTSLCEPGSGEIAVLAPHMDDEVLGYRRLHRELRSNKHP